MLVCKCCGLCGFVGGQECSGFRGNSALLIPVMAWKDLLTSVLKDVAGRVGHFLIISRSSGCGLDPAR